MLEHTHHKARALDKREYLKIIRDAVSYFSFKPYVVIPHLNRLIEPVQISGHNLCFYVELTNYQQIHPLI